MLPNSETQLTDNLANRQSSRLNWLKLGGQSQAISEGARVLSILKYLRGLLVERCVAVVDVSNTCLAFVGCLLCVGRGVVLYLDGSEYVLLLSWLFCYARIHCQLPIAIKRSPISFNNNNNIVVIFQCFEYLVVSFLCLLTLQCQILEIIMTYWKSFQCRSGHLKIIINISGCIKVSFSSKITLTFFLTHVEVA